MKTFKDYISQAKKELELVDKYFPLEKRRHFAYWVDFPNRRTGNNEADLYGQMFHEKDSDFEDKFIAKIINVAKIIKNSSEPEIANMTPDEYVKKKYGKCRLCGGINAGTQFCVLLYGGKDSPSAILPLSSLKGCENEIKKCVDRIFGAKIDVQTMPAKIIKMMEM